MKMINMTEEFNRLKKVLEEKNEKRIIDMIVEECHVFDKAMENWVYDGESLAVVYSDYSVDIFHFH